MKNYLLETGLILLGSYLVSLFLPWWAMAVVAAVVAFFLNANTKSFLSGFVAIALLWGVMAFVLSAPNEHLLAGKMGEMLGGLGAFGVMLVTAFIGGFVGGMGALTGKLGRKLL